MTAVTETASIKRPRAVALADRFDASLLRQAVLFVLAMKIVGIVLVFDPWGLQVFDLPKSLFSRAMAAVLAVTILAAVVRFGLGIVPRTWLHLPIAALLLANIVSAVFAENRYVAIFGDQDRYLGLTFLADMLVLYVACAIALRSLREFVSVAVCLAVATVFTFAYAVGQQLGLDPVSWATRTRAEPFGTFGHPDMFGHFLSVIFGFGLGLVAAAGLSRSTTPSLRAAGLIAALFSLALAVVVATRGTFLGMTAAVVTWVVIEMGQPGRAERLRQLPTIGAVAVALVAVSLPFTPLGVRLSQTFQDVGAGRLALYEAALRALLARPAFGYGPDSFGVAFPAFRQPPPYGLTDPQTSAHNWILQAGATTGIFGLLALLLAYGAVIRALWTTGRARNPLVALPMITGIAAYLVNGLVSVGTIALDWFPWVCFGATVALVGRRSISPIRPLGVGLTGILVLVAVLGALTPLAALRANRAAETARIEWNLNHAGPAISAAESAVTLDPGRAEYWNWLGLSYEQAGAHANALSAYRQASLRAPHEATYWMNLALAQARQALAEGDQSLSRAAVESGARAYAVDRYAPGIAETFAELAFKLDDFDLALRVSVQNTLLYDGYPTAGYRAFLAAKRASDLLSARRQLDAAIATLDTAQLRLALAEIALRSDDRAEAERSARRALELSRDEPDAVEILKQLGR